MHAYNYKLKDSYGKAHHPQKGMSSMSSARTNVFTLSTVRVYTFKTMFACDLFRIKQKFFLRLRTHNQNSCLSLMSTVSVDIRDKQEF